MRFAKQTFSNAAKYIYFYVFNVHIFKRSLLLNRTNIELFLQFVFNESQKMITVFGCWNDRRYPDKQVVEPRVVTLCFYQILNLQDANNWK